MRVVVVTVPPGGEKYSVPFIGASDEKMLVLGGRHFLSLYTGTKTDTTVLVIQTLENVR